MRNLSKLGGKLFFLTIFASLYVVYQCQYSDRNYYD